MASGIGRKRSETGGINPALKGIIDQVGGLFAPFNKTKKAIDNQTEGRITSPEDVLSLEMTDEELSTLTSTWTSEFAGYYAEVKMRSSRNFKYYKGEHYGMSNGHTGNGDGYGIVDNAIFQAVETLLPMVAREDPEPNVETDDTDTGIALADAVGRSLEDVSDKVHLRVKVRSAVRDWLIDLLGVLKVTWNQKTLSINVEKVDPKKLIIDPKGTFDGGKFTGRYIGQYVFVSGENVIVRFPEQKEWLTRACGGKLGTVLGFREWWTSEYVFWEMRGHILDKNKNPHWNYGYDEPIKGDDGEETGETQQVLGANHFIHPEMPFSFMWFFNDGERPFDFTSFIEQSISMQDLLNKRTKQIDKNADDSNNGWVFSNKMDQDQATQAVAALKRGGAIRAPGDDITKVVQRFQAPALPAYIVEDIQDKRLEIQNIFGIRGVTPSGTASDESVRGQIIKNQDDTSRSAPVVEQIEQMVDFVFNYMAQMMYVYQDEPNEEGVAKTDLTKILNITVEEGSMLPRNPLMRRNEAVDLFGSGSIDIVTELERLEYPDPKATAGAAMLLKINPMAYMQAYTTLSPEAMQALQQAMAPQQAPAPAAPQQPAAPPPPAAPPGPPPAPPGPPGPAAPVPMPPIQ